MQDLTTCPLCNSPHITEIGQQAFVDIDLPEGRAEVSYVVTFGCDSCHAVLQSPPVNDTLKLKRSTVEKMKELAREIDKAVKAQNPMQDDLPF